MKKYLFLILIAFTFSTIKSQNINDAMRYAQDNINGTARFSAMGGAFGALGGDLSSLNVNPAGSAVFTNNQMAVTLGNYSVKNNSEYFGTKPLKKKTLSISIKSVVFLYLKMCGWMNRELTLKSLKKASY